MDIGALWRSPTTEDDTSESSSDISEQLRMVASPSISMKTKRRKSIARRASYAFARHSIERSMGPESEFVLPTGVQYYNEKLWLEPDIRKIRRCFVSSCLFPTFQEGLNSYFSKDWSNAKKCFELILTELEDGPSQYFLKRMAEHDGVPPRDFIGYSLREE